MLWLKTFHIFFVIAWFVGLLYLPRLFVYHTQANDADQRARFIEMETKLYRMMGIGLIGTLGFGIAVLGAGLWGAYGTSTWLHLKLVLVALLIGHHHYCGRLIKRFRAGETPHGHVFFRWFNEIPAVILIGILILVVVKPF
ncbi:MAG: CopD family protein [Gammaproteobacteria bacterium]|nr:CopD family protein [Gammaproteobacteria bacterium]